ncbi:MAG TPA: hypothetical protein VGJ15_04965, partial [Pirellulales bacterium]
MQSCYALWAAAFPIRGMVLAGSKEQASLVIRAIRHLMNFNSWIGSALDVQRHVVRNKHTGSELLVVPGDADLAMGQICDFIICEELTSWPEYLNRLWYVAISTAAKKNNCYLQAISNAGVTGSWQDTVCQSLRKLPNCYVSQTDETETLLTIEQLEEQRQLLPPSEFARLFNNRFVSNEGDMLD